MVLCILTADKRAKREANKEHSIELANAHQQLLKQKEEERIAELETMARSIALGEVIARGDGRAPDVCVRVPTYLSIYLRVPVVNWSLVLCLAAAHSYTYTGPLAISPEVDIVILLVIFW